MNIRKEKTGMIWISLIFFLSISYSFDVKKIDITVKKNSHQFKANLFLIKGMGYLRKEEIENIYSLNVRFDKGSKRIFLGEDIILFLNSNSVIINGERKSLRKSPKIIKDRLYIPLELFLTNAFSKVTNLRTVWNYSEKLLTIFKEGRYDFIKFYSFPEFDRFYFSFSTGNYLYSKKEGNLIEVGFKNKVNFFEKIKPETEIIKEVRYSDNKILIYVSEGVKDYKVKRINKDFVLDIRKEKRKEIDIGIPVEEKKGIRTIVIDPGHGGKDPGAVGKKLKEKDVTLDIARRVAKILRKKGFRVILTRNYDVYLPLSQRAIIANRRGGDIFVSIHCNASFRKKSRGVEVYFLSDKATDEEARRVAEFENAPLEMEEEEMKMFKLEKILWSLSMNKYMNESSILAKFVLDEMKKYFPSPQRGVKQAGFYVLKGVQMPAILVEVGFITNRKEEKLLAKRKYRNRIAQAIAKGIMDYIEAKKNKR